MYNCLLVSKNLIDNILVMFDMVNRFTSSCWKEKYLNRYTIFYSVFLPKEVIDSLHMILTQLIVLLSSYIIIIIPIFNSLH